jgi:hypothetical protein
MMICDIITSKRLTGLLLRRIPALRWDSMTFLLALYVFLFFYRPLELDDGWWHLSAGRWIAEQRSVPSFDPFALNNERDPWIFTQWLGSRLIYGVYQISGLTGLQIFRALVFLLTAGIFFCYARGKIPWPFLAFLILIMSYGLSNRCLMRPLLFNFVFLQLLLITLLAYYKSERSRWLLLIPPLGALWFNLHLGSVVYGTLLIGIFLLSAVVQWLNQEWGKTPATSVVPSPRMIRGWMLGMAGYWASFLINPYGIKGVVYPLQVFLQQDYINFYKFADIIREMKPPVEILSSPAGIWFFLLIVAGMGSALTCRRDPFLKIFLFFTSFFMFLYSQRGSGFFTIVSMYIIADRAGDICHANRLSVSPAGGHDGQPGPQISRTGHHILLAGMALILLTGLCRIINNTVIIHNRSVRTLTLTVDPRTPDAAIAFLEKAQIHGPIFTNDTLGGYVIWRGYPQWRPFVDGRQLNQRRFQQFLDTIFDPASHWPDIVREYGIKAVLLDMSRKFYDPLILYLIADPGWYLVFVNGTSLVFVPGGHPSIPQAAYQLEQDLKAERFDESTLMVISQREPGRSLFSQALVPLPYYADILEEANGLMDLGFAGAGLRRLVSAYHSADQAVKDDLVRLIKEGHD